MTDAFSAGNVSFEPEFTLGRHEGASFTPIDESLCYSATGFHLAHDYTIDLVDALAKTGLEVEHLQAGNGAHLHASLWDEVLT